MVRWLGGKGLERVAGPRDRTPRALRGHRSIKQGVGNRPLAGWMREELGISLTGAWQLHT